MRRTYRMLAALLDARQRRGFLGAAALLLLVGLLDLAGVAMVLPFLAILADPEAVLADGPLRTAYDALGFASTDAFLRTLGLATFATVMAAVAARALAFYHAAVFAREANAALGTRRLAAHLSQPYAWFLGQHSADLSRGVLQEVMEITNDSIVTALRAIYGAWQVLLLGALLIVVEPVGALGMIAGLGLAFLTVDRVVCGPLARMSRHRRDANLARHQAVSEAFAGVREMKVGALEPLFLARYAGPSRRLAGYQARLSLIGELPRAAMEALTFGGVILLTLWLLWARDGQLERALPVLGALAFAALRLMPTMQTLFRDVAAMRYGAAALDALARDLREAPPPPPPAEPVPPLARALTLEDVTYAYPDAPEPVLRGLSMRIPSGSAVAICGGTGAGKSTVLDLILGLIQPDAGAVRIDGAALTPGRGRAWRARIGYVPQAIFLTDDSVAANIAQGEPPERIDPDRVARAARLARLDDVVAAMPEGYDTLIGDRGLRLSGGQRQRLGLARAIYRDPEVLILDEATSALDPATEARVMEALRAARGTRTLILVTHRIDSLDWCDRVFVLDGGVVADEGDPRAVSARPAFAALRAAAG